MFNQKEHFDYLVNKSKENEIVWHCENPIGPAPRQKVSISDVKVGSVLYAFVEDWDGYYDVPVDAMEVIERKAKGGVMIKLVKITSGNRNHFFNFDDEVLVYTRWPWWE